MKVLAIVCVILAVEITCAHESIKFEKYMRKRAAPDCSSCPGQVNVPCPSDTKGVLGAVKGLLGPLNMSMLQGLVTALNGLLGAIVPLSPAVNELLNQLIAGLDGCPVAPVP